MAALRAEGGIRALKISHVAHPDLRFPTPSGKIELYSERAKGLGLPPLPVHEDLMRRPVSAQVPPGTHADAVPWLLRPRPRAADARRRGSRALLWISRDDAAARGVKDGDAIRIYNQRGEMHARARVTDDIPPGTVWMRDGWLGLNTLTDGAAVIPDEAVDIFGFSGGQASFDAAVEVAPA